MVRRKDLIHIGVVIVIAALVILSTQPLSVNAQVSDQPYVGGYGTDGTAGPTIKAAFMVNDLNDKNGDNDIDQPLQSVLTVPGTNNALAGITGFMYQGVILWETNGWIYSNDQVYGPNQGKTAYDEIWHEPVPLVQMSIFDRATTNQFFVGTGASYVDFVHVIYKTDGFSFTQTPTPRYTKVSWDQSTKFYFGQCTGGTCYSGNPSTRTFKFFHFGIEAVSAEPTNYLVHQRNIAYKSPTATTWHYISDKQAYLMYGDSSPYVTWWTTNLNEKRVVTLGGWPYFDVYAKASLTDGSLSSGQVKWDSRDCGGARCHTPYVRLW